MSPPQRTHKKACDLVAEYEKSQGRTVSEAGQGSGYDLKSTEGKDVRKIEVKADTGSQLMGKHAYALTLQEWRTFSTDKNAWLYIIYSIDNSPKLVRLRSCDIRLDQLKLFAPQINISFRKDDGERLMQKAEDLS